MIEIPDSNWAKSFRYGFRACLFPASTDELAETVAAAERIKVLGSRHSFNAIADGDVAVILNQIPLGPAIEADGKTVSIAGHATYGDLAAFLAGHGLAVHNLASLPHISIAGAIATATHGSGERNGNLATAVSAIEIMASDGRIVKISRGERDFDGMIVHLGALGVVTRVSLDVQPAFEIRQSVYEGLSWDSLYQNLDHIMGAGYSVSVFTRWGEQAGQIWVKDAAASESASARLYDATLAAVKRHPIPEMDPTNATDQLGVAGLWSDRLPHFKMGFTPSNGDEIQSEFHIPRKHGAAAIKAVAAISDSFRALIQTTEFRAVAADTLWLSPQYENDTLSMHFTWISDAAAVDAAVRRIEEALSPFGALPHWGKVFSRSPVGARYAKLAAFSAIRDRMDPQRKFSNRWLENVVFGEA
jgi:xylitol oxidase